MNKMKPLIIKLLYSPMVIKLQDFVQTAKLPVYPVRGQVSQNSDQ